MTTITIFEKTHEAACTGALGQEDLTVYRDNIDKYWDFLISEAAADNINVNFEQNSAGASYSSDSDEGHNFMQSIKDFWSWYN